MLIWESRFDVELNEMLAREQVRQKLSAQEFHQLLNAAERQKPIETLEPEPKRLASLRSIGVLCLLVAAVIAVYLYEINQ